MSPSLVYHGLNFMIHSLIGDTRPQDRHVLFSMELRKVTGTSPSGIKALLAQVTDPSQPVCWRLEGQKVLAWWCKRINLDQSSVTVSK